MRRGRKLIIISMILAVVAIGSISGVALAQSGEDNSPAGGGGGLMERACAIYEANTGVAIDQAALMDAIAQAQSEMQAAAMETRLEKMVENGVLTEEQAQALLEWWQSRPDVPFDFGFGGQGVLRGGCGGPGGFGTPLLPEGFEPPE
jgi:hypothetical protein